MTQFSPKLDAIKPSPTLALNQKVKNLIAEGKDIYNFSVGECDIDAPKAIQDALVASLQSDKVRYSQVGGVPGLRSAIAEKISATIKAGKGSSSPAASATSSAAFDPSQVVVSFGAKDILFHLFHSILTDGDEVIVLSPYWVSYPAQVSLFGAKTVVVPFEKVICDGKFSLQASHLLEYITSKTKAIVLNSPNNPAGYVMPQAFYDDLLNALATRNTKPFVVSDEIYEYLNFSGEDSSILKSPAYEAYKEHVVYINGLSKGYFMTGWRIGYCAASDEVCKRVKKLISQSSTCMPIFLQKAAQAAIELDRSHFANAMQAVKDRRKLSLDILKNLEFVHPDGAFYLFVDCRRALESSSTLKTSLQLSEFLLEKYNIAATPGEAFGADGFVRLNTCLDEADLESGLKSFKSALENLP